MPFCSQCGNQVGATEAYCARCGAQQPTMAGAANPLAHDPLSNISPRTASILCYVPVMGWIASIIVLASHRFRHTASVRFHAFQGLYLFVAWLLNDQVLKWAFLRLHLHEMVNLVLLAMSIFMMVKASRDEAYALPLFGELAQRSVSES